MRADLGILGIFFPLAIFFIASIGPIKGRSLWILSLLVSMLSSAVFLFLTSGFYLGIYGADQWISSQTILQESNWFGEVGFRWSFFSSILSSAVTLVVVCFHFLGRKILENSRASTGSLSAFLCCILGAIGSGNLFLFACFYVGTILPRFVFSGVGSRDEHVTSIKEISFLQLNAVYCLLVIVLLFAKPFQAQISEWFRLDFGSHEVLPGSVGFLIFMLALVIASGLFPFHQNLKRIYSLNPIERAIPVSLFPVLGQALMFHFSSEYFSAELKTFSQPLSALFAVGFFWSAVNFSSTKPARLRVFWLQQAMSTLVAVGFFSLQAKGWHGAAAISFFQIIAIPFLLMVLGCHERREKISLYRIAEYPMFALSSVTAILVGLFLPISLGFYGAFLVIWGLVDQSPWYMYLVVASLPILVLSGIQSMFFVLGETGHTSGSESTKDFSREEMLAILPIGIFLLFLGLIPKALMDPIGTISLAMLKKIGMGE